MSVPAQILQGILARCALTFLRIYFGAILLVAGIGKHQSDFTPRLTGFLNEVALAKAQPSYQEFVRGVVLPHAQIFAGLVSWGEVLVGAALVLGLCTRLAASAGVLLTLNYMLAKGNWPWYPSSNDAAFAAISIALLIGAAGRTLGLDVFLGERWPRSPFW
jgi:thiosulfate dehydrogenase (quinone) large subunit